MQCTHQGGPLADGTLEGYEVECPLHGAKFDIRTGEVTNPPPSTPESAYAMIHLSGPGTSSGVLPFSKYKTS